MNTDVTLTPFSSSKITRLRRWLAAPHVAAWYPDPDGHVRWAANLSAGSPAGVRRPEPARLRRERRFGDHEDRI